MEVLYLNIPNKVRIGSFDYTVEITEKNLVLDGREAYATIDYNNHKIEVNKRLGDKQSNELCFLHELFHALVRERNLTLDDEELVVEELARGMYQVIRDNPNMFT